MHRKSPPRLKSSALDDWQQRGSKVGQPGLAGGCDPSLVRVRLAPSFTRALPLDPDEDNAANVPVGAHGDSEGIQSNPGRS